MFLWNYMRYTVAIELFVFLSIVSSLIMVLHSSDMIILLSDVTDNSEVTLPQ